jgi:hypothetical protein
MIAFEYCGPDSRVCMAGIGVLADASRVQGLVEYYEDELRTRFGTPQDRSEGEPDCLLRASSEHDWLSVIAGECSIHHHWVLSDGYISVMIAQSSPAQALLSVFYSTLGSDQ